MTLSPFASVLIKRQSDQGEAEIITEYFGSSLRGGQAFAKAIRKAQADRRAREVSYMELVDAKVTVQASVQIVHDPVTPSAETRVSLEMEEGDFPF